MGTEGTEGTDQYMTLRIWRELVDRIDAHAERMAATLGARGVKVSRSQVIQDALDALDAECSLPASKPSHLATDDKS